jgi:uncharacterized membrane protein YozB (DUF420 family)
MSTTGFLGTRADVFIDLAFVFFVAAPFVMTYALRLVALRRRRAHRNLQAGLLLAAVVATLLLEGSIRFGDGAAAFALSAYYGTATMYWTFAVHLAVAVPTFVSWCILTVLSWRRFSRVLPGPFSSRHRRWGQLTYAGLWFTCITGVGLYVMSYAL